MTALAWLLAAVTTAACPTPGVLPPPLAAWATPSTGSLAVGHPTSLRPSLGQSFAVTTGKPPKPGTFAASVPFRIERPANYEVALSDAAWIDVIAGKTAIKPSAHRHGPACSDISKIVTFALEPGNYALQVSGDEDDAVTVAITPAAR